MANRLSFHYFPGNSLLHRWDTRCKFFGLLALTLGLLRMEASGLALFTALLLLAFVVAGIPWKPLISDLKAWGFFLVLIFLVQAFLIPHQPDARAHQSVFSFDALSIGRAAVICWRLTLILCYAVLFTMATRPRDLQNGLLWLMKPLPSISGRRIALMITLTLRFLPLILDQAEEVRQAIKSRGGNERKNPLYRARIIVLPLFRRSLLRADEMALALAARGYREDLPVQIPKVPLKHALFLLLWVMLVLGSSARSLHFLQRTLGQ